MKKLVQPWICTVLLLLLTMAVGRAQEITYGFVQDPMDPLNIIAVAYPDFMSSDVTMSTANFSFTLPEGTVTDPAIVPIPGSGSFVDLTGTWDIERLTPMAYTDAGFDGDNLNGNDVYAATLLTNPNVVLVPGVPLELFSFRLSEDCFGGNLAVLENDSELPMTVFDESGINLNNQMALSVGEAMSEDLYVGNEPESAQFVCPIVAPPLCPTPFDLTATASSDGTVTLSWFVDETPGSIDDHVFTLSIGGTGIDCDNAATAGVVSFVIDDSDFDTLLAPEGLDLITFSFNGLENGLVRSTSYQYVVTQTCNEMAVLDDNTSDCVKLEKPFKIPETPFVILTEPSSPTCIGGDDGTVVVTIEDGTCAGTYDITLAGETQSAAAGEPVVFSGLEADTYEVSVLETSGCLLEENPQTTNVTVEDPAENPLATVSIFEFLGAPLGTSDDDPVVLDPVLLPPGTCSMTMQYTLSAASACEEICEADAFTVAHLVNGVPVEDLFADVTTEGSCDYLLTVKFLPGLNEITIGGEGIDPLTLVVEVTDSTIPVVSVASGLNFTIPACAETVSRTLVVQVDDLCGLGLLNLQAAGGSLGAYTFTEADIVDIDPLAGTILLAVELSLANDGDVLTLAVADESGNEGTFSAPISVSQATADGEPVILAADATVFVPACEPSAPFTYSLQVVDDCQTFDPEGFSVTPDLTALGLTVAVMETGMVRVSGELPFGEYTITYTYDNGVADPVSKTVSVIANTVPNAAPEIVVPGNQTVTLSACGEAAVTTWAFQISDDCDEIEADNLMITIDSDPVAFTLLNGQAVFTASVSLENDGSEISASYTDSGELTTTTTFELTVLQAEDEEAPVVVYPSQDITLVLDACAEGPGTQVFQVTANDNCDAEVDLVVTAGDGATLLNLPGTSVYVFTGSGDADGEVYPINITATDEAGNVTEESFSITVRQDEPEVFAAACRGAIIVSLEEDCQATITPQMAMSGEFGCVDPLTDLKITVLDGDESNGPVVDGCGDFMFRVDPVLVAGEIVTENFTGDFAPGNFTLTSESADVTVAFNGNTSIEFANPDAPGGGFGQEYSATAGIAVPATGTASFDFSFFTDEFVGGSVFELLAYTVSADGGVSSTVLASDGEGFEGTDDDGLLTGSASIELNEGDVLFFLYTVDGLNPAGGSASIANFSYTVVEEGTAANPLLNGFQGCMGMVSTKDLTTPEVVAPEATSVNVQNGLPLYCEQAEDLSVVAIPLADRCYVVTAAGANLPAGDPRSINHPSKRALRDILNVTGFPEVTDNCGQVEVCVSDAVINDDPCADYQILRTFRVRDGINSTCDGDNTNQATQTITLTRPELVDIVRPTSPAELDCGTDYATLPNGNPSPVATGFPTLQTGTGVINVGDGQTGAIFCNIGAAFEDGPRVTTCGGSFKFERTWTLFDWCGPDGSAITETYVQIIKVGDFTPPTIDYASNLPTVFSTNAFGCTAVFVVPTPNVSDNCSAEVTTIAYVYAFGDLDAAPFGPYNVGEITDALPKGDHVLEYVATDVCGNESRLNVEITIADQTAPVAKCDDDFNASLGGTGQAWFSAEEIDAGSYDECTDVRLEVRRSIANFETAPGPGAGPNPTNASLFTDWAPTVSFTCDDADRYVRVELRVWDDGNMNGIIGDAGDNSNTCWLDLLIENKLPPVCVAPAPVTVKCTDLDPNFPNDLQAAYDEDPEGLSTLLGDAFGYAAATGNCGAEVTELRPIDGRDECGFGTITRRFEASVGTSTGEQTTTCNQQIVVQEVHEYDIKFPMDDEFDCNIDPVGPTVETYEIGCDLLSIYRDTVRFQATGDECYKLRKTIQLINWCEYDGIGDPIVLSRDEDNDGISGEMFWVAVEGDRAFVRRNRETGLLREIAGYANAEGRGYFEYVQFLKVYDNVAPTIDVVTEEFEFCSVAATCDAPVTIEFTVDDACTPDQTQMLVTAALDAFVVDANGDGTISLAEFTADQPLTVSGNGTLSVGGTFPIGRHAIRIDVEDGCGNYAAELVLFDVVDCKAPAPICINGLTVTLMPDPAAPGGTGGMMSIWASDYLASPIDDCSGIVGYAIYRTEDVIAIGDEFVADPADTGLDLTCEDLGMLSVRVYAIDGAGNFDYCETSLLVQANTPTLCTGTGFGSIAGTIATEYNEAVEGVEVSLTGDLAASVVTQADGAFLFSNLPEGEDYTVTPFLNSNHKNGVSTFDLVLIQKHILGIQSLDSPYKMIAADANDSGGVSTLDLIQIRRLILDITTEYPDNTSWRFVEADYQYPNTLNPWQEDFPEILNVNDLAGDVTANFIGIKIGDVNGSATANLQTPGAPRSFRGELDFYFEETMLRTGETYRLPVRATDLATVQGYQFTLGIDLLTVELLDLEPGLIGLEHFGFRSAEAGLLTTSWNATADDPLRLSGEEVLFSLVLRAKTEVRLSEVLTISDRITPAEAYDSEDRFLLPQLSFRTQAIVDRFVLHQNIPNPFAKTTIIDYELPRAMPVTITISDIAGKTLRVITQAGQAGANRLELTRQQLSGAVGILNYTVTTAEWTATKKMIVTD